VSPDGVEIHYQVRATGTPAIVFIHGWSCDATYWNAQLPFFSSRYKVVTIDLAGHGASGLNRKEWTIPAFAEDVTAVVNKLDLRHVVLVGHSMGADVALEAARQMPERVNAIVTVDAFRTLQPPTPEQIEQFLAPLRADFAKVTDTFVRRLFAPSADPNLVDRIARDMAAAPPGPALASSEALQNYRSKHLLRALADAAVPIVAINSDMRPSDVPGFTSMFPSFEFIIMSGVGHFPMMEDPNTFNKLLADTLQNLNSTNDTLPSALR
jgi:pimeloyl-ACP methyl ester carboxylesterase